MLTARVTGQAKHMPGDVNNQGLFTITEVSVSSTMELTNCRMRITAALLVATVLVIGSVSAVAGVQLTATPTPPTPTLRTVVDPFCWGGEVGRCIVNQTACSGNADCPDQGRCVNTNAPCMGDYECPYSYCGRCVCYPRSTPTATPISGTPACYGDCNGDGRVTVDEILILINIALGDLPTDTCPALSGDCCPPLSGIVCNCAIVAASNALHGCSQDPHP